MPADIENLRHGSFIKIYLFPSPKRFAADLLPIILSLSTPGNFGVLLKVLIANCSLNLTRFLSTLLYNKIIFAFYESTQILEVLVVGCDALYSILAKTTLHTVLFLI